MPAADHPLADRVLELLRCAKSAADANGFCGFREARIGLEVTAYYSPDFLPPSDAANCLGGIGDVLEDKGRRGPLARFSLCGNDRQICEVAYREATAETAGYHVRLWELDEPPVRSGNLERLPS